MGHLGITHNLLGGLGACPSRNFEPQNSEIGFEDILGVLVTVVSSHSQILG